MSTAVAPPQNGVSTKKPSTLKEWLKSDTLKAEIAQALPKHLSPERFMRIALTALTRTPKLAECDQASFFKALLDLSQYGIEPDGRRAHLIPFWNSKRNCNEVQLIVDYKGIAELIMRSGLISNLHADVVCDNDEFEYDRGFITKHIIDFRKPRGDIYAVYCVCRMKDGTEKCDVMSKADVDKIQARSKSGRNGPWVTDWAEMAKKTVFKRLSKWLPWSPEIRDAIEHGEEDEYQANIETSRIIETTGATRSDELAAMLAASDSSNNESQSDDTNSAGNADQSADQSGEQSNEPEKTEQKPGETTSEPQESEAAKAIRAAITKATKEKCEDLLQQLMSIKSQIQMTEYEAVRGEIAARLREVRK